MKIVSWNIQWGRGADGRVDLRRTAELLQGLDPHVICLQEVAVNMHGLAGAAPEDGVARLCSMLPGYIFAFAPAVDVANQQGERMYFGNLTLSRLPIGQVWRHLLPWPADPTVPAMQRACLELVLNAPNNPIRILNTHLEYYSKSIRLAQAGRLVELQREAEALARTPSTNKDNNPAFKALPRPEKALLCGDMNCEPSTSAHKRLSDEGVWHDAWPLVHGTRAHAPTVGLHGAEWPKHPYCCDYFFVSNVIQTLVKRIQVIEDTAASDHQPILLELEV
ncbi:MAG: endonuclease/exonuclease/phosphatase family protein [Betaproteobacteria bacterium]|nr:endonuclease/exonuclease/phosphatase family protein [Betaproteobacteria bacterium]